MLALYIVLGIITLALGLILTMRLIWNVRLRRFQKKNGIPFSRESKVAFGSNIAGLNLLLLVGILTIFGGISSIKNQSNITFKEYTEGNVTYTNAKQFTSNEEFEKIVSNIRKTEYTHRGEVKGQPGADKDATPPGNEPGRNGDETSSSDTYEQVLGISEADIAKVSKSGDALFYAPTYGQSVYKIRLGLYGEHLGEYERKIFNDVMITEMILHEKYLIVFGRTYPSLEKDLEGKDRPAELYASIGRYWDFYKSVYLVFEVDTFKEVVRGEVEGSLIETRLVGDVLYMLSRRHIEFDDRNRPVNLPDFKDIYYFSGDFATTGLTMLTSFNLGTLESKKLGFVGGNQSFFMGHNYIILVSYRWNIEKTISSVIVVDYDKKTGDMKYVGSSEVVGMVLNQYFMDDYKEQVRVVTTHGPNSLNSLYIFEVDEKSDKLKLLSLLNERIGKERESVKSVSFKEDIVQIVTFFVMDPLYTIDLSDPYNPKILPNPVEEEGFSTGITIWDDHGNSIGIGFMSDGEGRITGVKVSAYRSGVDVPVQIVEFSYEKYGYVYVPATYNQRQNLFVDKKLELYGFILHNVRLESTPTDSEKPYEERYKSMVVVFHINFDKADEYIMTLVPKLTDELYNYNIEKIVSVNETIHILSRIEDLNFNMTTYTFSSPLRFDGYEINGDK